MAELLWVVAALIVGSMIYVSALERTRDFAVFKAVGVPTRSILAGLILQAVIVAILAAALGAGLSLLLGPLFPMRCDIPQAAFVALPIVAVLIGLLASVAGLRRAVTVDPAMAFGAVAMPDLRIKDPSSSTRARRIRCPADRRTEPRRQRGIAGDPARPQRMREDHTAVLPGGILSPQAGTIEFGEADPTKLGQRELTEYRRNTVGIVFQAFNLVSSPHRPGNVMVPMRAAGMSKKHSRQRAEELLQRVGLADRMRHRPGDMSGGQQQRVAVARAIVTGSPLILADEPTAHPRPSRSKRSHADPRTRPGERVVVVATHDTRMLPLADTVGTDTPDHLHRTRTGGLGLPPPARPCSSRAAWAIRSTWWRRVKSSSCANWPAAVKKRSQTVRPGDYFGEMGPIFRPSRSATVRATVPSKVIGYSVQAFRERMGAAGSAEVVDQKIPRHE